MRHKSNVSEVFPSPRVFTQPRDLLGGSFVTWFIFWANSIHGLMPSSRRILLKNGRTAGIPLYDNGVALEPLNLLLKFIKVRSGNNDVIN